MKRHVDGLADTLNQLGFKTLALHGDMHNRERERAVKALATGRVQVVIATDVAARGLDINDISLVVNYDIPNNYDTYVHRIGRTGRGTKLGSAITFVPKRG
jgi:ATP-dependent RNA helicase DeaD